MKIDAAHSDRSLKAGRTGTKTMKNKGFTLIELIVVMAIVAIAGTMAWMSINAVFGFEAKKAAQYIYAAMEKCKVEQMTKAGDCYIHLYRDEDGVYLDLYENGEIIDNEFEDGNQIASSKVSVTYKLPGDTKGTQLDKAGIVIAFNRSDGSFKTVGHALELHWPDYTSDTDNYYEMITVTSGGTSRSIMLYPNTGKFEYT